MRNMILILFVAVFLLSAETLFQVKDSSDRVVLDVSSDGLRVLNEGDTLMVISSDAIRANIGATNKGLSRSFSVTTTSSVKGKGLINALEVNSESASMTSHLGQYTDFSPDNIFIGLNSGINSRPGQIEPYYGKYNTFMGNEAGYSNTYGFGNIFIGYQAGYFSTTSNQNISIGYQAGYNMTGQSNTLIGHLVGKGSGSGGDYNSFYGRAAGFSIGTAGSNTLIGALSGSALTNGYSNTLIGKDAGKGQSGAAFSYNTVLGSAAATQLTTGGNNVILGYNAGGNITTGSGNIFLGYQSGASETGSNKLYIENSNSTTPLIWGDFANDLLRFNGNVGIGTAPSTSYGLYAVDDYQGVRGYGSTSTGSFTYGVYGSANGGTSRNVSIYGASATGTGANWAGYFYGNVYVSGTVSKSSDEVKIDHPLNPENKYLSHSGVISDEMTTVYNGNTILDITGSSTIALPGWFEAMNKDFKYQITAIGAPGPNLYISKEVSDNSFAIAGGSPGMKISWQITAVRNDNYAKSNHILNENEKKDYEKGYYLHPEAYGLTEDKGIEYNIEKNRNETELK